MPRITFHGAAGTVTGSRHLIEDQSRRILVDCGLFQGERGFRENNWKPFPVPPHSIDAVVLTHAHMDHIGYLPRLVKEGYGGPIYATPATAALARVSLPDSGRIQEEDAAYLNRKGLSRHHPALPLYTEKDAFECLKQFSRVPYGQFHRLPGKMQWRYLPAGHILGSAFAELYFENGERILMSGDLGRPNTPIIVDPTVVDGADYLVIESTYGDRLHSKESPKDKLERVLHEAFDTGGVVLVPSFAIGRTQELLYYLSELQREERLPRIPIFLDSPMATSTTALYERHEEDHDEEMIELSVKEKPLDPAGLDFVRDHHQSKALNSRSGPMMIIAGSGMATAGRIVHHLLSRLGDPQTTVLFTGYQAQGTLGRSLLEREPTVTIRGVEVAVRARIEKLNALSAHADQAEIMAWLRNFKAPPRRTFIVHGEPPAQEALRAKIAGELGWDVVVPRMHERFDL